MIASTDFTSTTPPFPLLDDHEQLANLPAGSLRRAYLSLAQRGPA